MRSSPFATAAGPGSRGGAFIVGNLEHVPEQRRLQRALRALPDAADPEPFEPAPAFEPQVIVEERETNQSHLRMSYRPQVDVTDVSKRAALTIYATLLGGSMSSRLFDEIREQRGLAYSVYGVAHAHADVPLLQLGAGLDSTKCVEAYTRMREIVNELRDDGPTRGRGLARPRLRRRAAACSRSRTRTPSPATPPSQSIVFGEQIDPDGAIAALDAVTLEEVTEIARDVADTLAVACVGPHSEGDFS